MSHQTGDNPADMIGAPPRVLVVADSIGESQVVRSILDPFDLNITHAASGEIALELASVIRFDVILVDQALAGMPADVVTRRLRSERNGGGGASIIALTAEPDLIDPAAGYNGLLSKPFTEIDLTTAILVALVEQEAVNARAREVALERCAIGGHAHG